MELAERQMWQELYEESLTKRKEDKALLSWYKRMAREHERRKQRVIGACVVILSVAYAAAWIVARAAR